MKTIKLEGKTFHVLSHEELKGLKKSRQVVTTSRVTPVVRMLLRRGTIVPLSMEHDWQNLKQKGVSNEEAARMLNLPWVDPTKVTT